MEMREKGDTGKLRQRRPLTAHLMALSNDRQNVVCALLSHILFILIPFIIISSLDILYLNYFNSMFGTLAS